MIKTDVIIVGSGCSGLYCALHLPRNKKIMIITKSPAERSDSYLAQGGICVLRDEEDFESFFEDTLKAGHYENDRKSVEIMIRSSQDVIKDLTDYGVEFSKTEDGELNYTREGAHSRNRILFHRDITGKEITGRLLDRVKERENITVLENTTMVDIVQKNNECFGVVAEMSDGRLETIGAEYTVLACGGIGGLFRHSTNFGHLTGDAIAIAIKHGVETKNLDYIQIHPTTLYSDAKKERRFLISESVRGEGAKLYDKNMNRFVDELLPRDRLTAAIEEQMEKDGTDFVWEDLSVIPETELDEHFPNIRQHCLDNNYDIKTECIPVVPAQHYFMGGIKVDHSSKTSMERLYAIGETACNGVHGKNRLASNSLLESLVFAKRAALEMTENPKEAKDLPQVDFSEYNDRAALKEKYKKLIFDEIDKSRDKTEQ